MSDLTWLCEAHGVVTDGDCLECDAELIALADELECREVDERGAR